MSTKSAPRTVTIPHPEDARPEQTGRLVDIETGEIVFTYKTRLSVDWEAKAHRTWVMKWRAGYDGSLRDERFAMTDAPA